MELAQDERKETLWETGGIEAGQRFQEEGKEGDPPYFSAENMDCGIRFLTDFWEEKYLKEYIRDGGSKIKFLTGRKGSGKTHFLKLATAIAQKHNYKTVHFSARDVWMHDFKEIYIEIFHQCNILDCLKGASFHVIREMGFDRYGAYGAAGQESKAKRLSEYGRFFVPGREA